MATASVNTDLALATVVQRMEVLTDLGTGRTSLVLELIDDDRHPSVRILVEANGVSQLRLEDFGGGVTQLLCLRARDVSEQQLDRVRLILEDLEHGKMSVRCEDVVTTRVLLDAKHEA